MIKTIIVDDEPLARKRIAKLLDENQDFKLLKECRNGEEALKFIKKKKPDLIFLDVQMPGLDGFELVQKLEKSYKPFIIFVTAFEQYAVKAFDVKAIDYLLKPFDDERFQDSLKRARDHYSHKKSADLNIKLIDLVGSFQKEKSGFLIEFEIKHQGKNLRIAVEKIYYIESYGNYLKLFTENEFYLYRETMNTVEEELDPSEFIRVHRSFIVNKECIEKLIYLNTNEYQIFLKNGNTITSSRGYKEQITNRLSDYI
jgi:two-component system, LytTR family, response regulator